MCDSCQVLRINGIVTHEIGCHNSSIGKKYMCKWCGNDFTIESPNENHEVCSHSCMVAYNGFDCDCEECNPELEAKNETD